MRRPFFFFFGGRRRRRRRRGEKKPLSPSSSLVAIVVLASASASAAAAVVVEAALFAPPPPRRGSASATSASLDPRVLRRSIRRSADDVSSASAFAVVGRRRRLLALLPAPRRRCRRGGGTTTTTALPSASSSEEEEEAESYHPSSPLPSEEERRGRRPPRSLPQYHRPLASSYDATTLPAGLRGEAVRSAIRSDRGVCFDFTSSSTSHREEGRLNVGCVKVEGPGAVDFLNNKLTGTFRDVVAVVGGTMEEEEDEGVMMGRLAEACLLTPRGRTVDRILVPTFPSSSSSSSGKAATDAYLVTSPGHSGSALFDRLDPLIFPLDGVKLTDMCPDDDGGDDDAAVDEMTTRVITVAASRIGVARGIVRRYALPHLGISIAEGFSFPLEGMSARYRSSSERRLEVAVLPSTFLPPCVCVGYTLIITEGGSSSSPSSSSVGQRIWEALTDEDDMDGPVELGPLEYEGLRIEGGMPGYGTEMTGDDDDGGTDGNDGNGGGGGGGVVVGTKAGPLELNLDPLVDAEKGCYLGQEGVSAMSKNRRGVPRTLYCVVFRDDRNAFDDGDEEGISDGSEDDEDDDYIISVDDLLAAAAGGGTDDDDDGPVGPDADEAAASEPNLTRHPRPGDVLNALGSDGEIRVGTVTSVSERGATGEPSTVGLALVRRPGPILTKMERMGLEISGGGSDDLYDPFADDPLWRDGGSGAVDGAAGSVADDDGASGIIRPPPLRPPPPLPPVDPLDGLEVVIEGTYTAGMLRAVPSRRLPPGANIYEEEAGEGGRRPGIATEEEAEGWMRRNGRRAGDDDDIGRGGGGAERILRWDDELAAVLPRGWEDAAAEEEEEDGGECGSAAAMAAAATAEDVPFAVATEGQEEEEEEGEEEEILLPRASEAAEEATRAADEEAEATAAAEAEAKRKADKMDMLRKRAEEAMERRRKAKKEAEVEKEAAKEEKAEAGDQIANTAAAAKEAEERRKAEKMEALKRKAEEVMARRREKDKKKKA